MSKVARIRYRHVLPFVLVLAIASCGDEDSPSEPGNSGDNDVRNSITFTRQDDSIITMGDNYAICCAIWEEGYIDKNTLKIFFYGSTQEDSFWKLFIVVDEVVVGSTYDIPTATDDPVKIFLVDGSNSNELSGDAEDSLGTVTVNSLDCGPPLSIDLTIDATIGSEFFQAPTVRVSGAFTANIHSNPSPFGCGFAM